MTSAAEVLAAFERIRRAQHEGEYAPHKPLLILLALARVQRGEPRLVEFAAVDEPMKRLLTEFGRSRAAGSRHYPFWHLHTDGQGALWELDGPRQILGRPAGATPTIGELRRHHLRGGFPPQIDDALRHTPGLLQEVATQVLEAYFPSTLHGDIAAALDLDLTPAPSLHEPLPPPAPGGRQRSPGFRDRVLLAYEYRCCVCGFDLRIGHFPAGLEAAHIQWHQAGGPDIEPNGLCLCSLHHKLFDLGAFTIEPSAHRLVFSQHAIDRDRGTSGELRFHGRPISLPEDDSLRPAPLYLAWNARHVFKEPPRRSSADQTASQLR